MQNVYEYPFENSAKLLRTKYGIIQQKGVFNILVSDISSEKWE